jgi:hypothetical protein
VSVVIVRYTTKPDRADENQVLIENVFGELDQHEPEGLRYASFRLADGVSFVHVAGSRPATAPTRSRRPQPSRNFCEASASDASSDRLRPKRRWSARTDSGRLIHRRREMTPSTSPKIRIAEI